MFRIFDYGNKFSRANVKPPAGLYLTRATQQIVKTYQKYYSEQVETYIHNAHLFVNVMKFLELSISTPVDEVQFYTRKKLLSLSTLFGVVSYGQKGRPVFPGQFYGRYAAELYINDDTYFEEKNNTSAWTEYSPARIVRHGRTAWITPFLDNNNHGPEGEVVVIIINFNMLACQYHMWRIDNYKNKRDTGTAQEFVTKVFIPGLIKSHLDIVVLNRIMNDVFLLPNDDKSQVRLPFRVIDVRGRVKAYCEQVAGIISKTTMTHEEVLSNLPLLSSEAITAAEALQTPDTLFTVQNRWALMVGYLPVIIFLTSLDIEQGNNRNSDYKGTLRRRIMHMQNDGSMTQPFQSSASGGIAPETIEAELEQLKMNLSI